MAERKGKPLDEAAIRRDERVKTLRYVVRVLRAEARKDRQAAADIAIAAVNRSRRDYAIAESVMAEVFARRAEALVAGKRRGRG